MCLWGEQYNTDLINFNTFSFFLYTAQSSPQAYNRHTPSHSRMNPKIPTSNSNECSRSTGELQTRRPNRHTQQWSERTRLCGAYVQRSSLIRPKASCFRSGRLTRELLLCEAACVLSGCVDVCFEAVLLFFRWVRCVYMGGWLGIRYICDSKSVLTAPIYVRWLGWHWASTAIIMNRNSKAVQGKQRRGAAVWKYHTRVLHALPSAARICGIRLFPSTCRYSVYSTYFLCIHL